MLKSCSLLLLLALAACTDSALPEAVPTDDGSFSNSTTPVPENAHTAAKAP